MLKKTHQANVAQLKVKRQTLSPANRSTPNFTLIMQSFNYTSNCWQQNDALLLPIHNPWIGRHQAFSCTILSYIRVYLMKFAYKILPLVLAASQSMPAMAAPASFMNARAFAMGGTGVSSARPGAAGFYNPALLSVDQEEKNDTLSLFLPSVNARVAYDDDLIDKLDNYQDNNTFDKLTKSIDTYNANKNSANLQSVIDATKAVDKDLASLDKLSAGADIGAGTSFAMPGKTLGAGLIINTSIKAASTLRYNDGATLTSFINDVQTIKDIADGNSNATLADLQKIVENNASVAATGEIQLQSDAIIVGAAISEVGIVLSHEFNIGDHSYAVGITPKIVRADLFNYQVDPNKFESSDFDSNDFTKSETSFNFDIGIARQFGATKSWTAGLAVRNVIPTTYDFTPNKLASVNQNNLDMKIEPQVTVGISHTSDWHTIAVDLDLTENRHFGLEDDEQFLSVGAEFDVFDMLQLRAGFRYNLATENSTPKALQEETVVTAGIGLDIFSFNLAVSGYASNTQKGIAAEMGVVF